MVNIFEFYSSCTHCFGKKTKENLEFDQQEERTERPKIGANGSSIDKYYLAQKYGNVYCKVHILINKLH